MSDTKVPKGWATPNTPPPPSVTGSVIAGIAALVLTLGAGVFIAKNVSSKGKHPHAEQRAAAKPKASQESRTRDAHKLEAHKAIQKSAAAAAAQAKALAAKEADEAQKAEVKKAAAKEAEEQSKAGLKLIDKAVAGESKPVQIAQSVGEDLKDLDMPMLPIERKTKTWLEKGNQHIEARRFRSAIGEFRKVLKSDPKRAEAHRGMGIAYARLGKVEKARRSYKRYIELAPDAPDAPDVRRLLGQ